MLREKLFCEGVRLTNAADGDGRGEEHDGHEAAQSVESHSCDGVLFVLAHHA